jgi:hypothetical protein
MNVCTDYDYPKISYVVKGGLKMSDYGGLKMSFFGGENAVKWH